MGAERVRRTEALPPDYDRIGRVAAHCERVEGFQPLDGTPFADLDCSFERLGSALAEAAAEAGGELLVGQRCQARARVRSCAADVARPSERALARRSLEGRSEPARARSTSTDEPRPGTSWYILLSFDPAAQEFSRPAREPGEVVRTGALPPHHQALGDLVARCERGTCDEGELAWALRVTAARFGADSLAGVRCFETEDDSACVGTLGATPFLEPELAARR